MKKGWVEYSKDFSSQMVYDSLDNKEKQTIDKYKDYILITASEFRAKESVREILRFRYITDKTFSLIGLEDLRYFLKEVKTSDFADYSKNRIKAGIKRFLRWHFKDWSERFDEFMDIKNNGDAQRMKPITSKEIFSKDDIKKLLDSEQSLFWKTFLIIQYEGGLRTGEVRTLTWDRVNFEDDGFVTLKILCKKNKNGTIKERELPLKDSSVYLQKLKEQQQSSGIKTKWVFPSPQDCNNHISKSVNIWFNHLTKRVLNRQGNNYLLRHTKGTELKKLIKEGGMSKDNATEFMGHSEKMFDKVYSHMDKEDIKELMKKQIYNFEYMPEEKKHKLELELETLKKQIHEDKKQNAKNIFRIIDGLNKILPKKLKEKLDLSGYEIKEVPLIKK